MINISASSFARAHVCTILNAGTRMASNTHTTAGTYNKIPRSKLHVSKPVWWLESRFHFSFADYFNLDNTNFGALRVLNDDLVQPRAGFGRHPHRDAEIFTYVVQGQLSHQDSMGNKEALPRGCVQYLSAGTGITHSEMNEGSEVCRFLQIWLTPDRHGHTPQYGSTTFDQSDRHNKLLHILGGTKKVPDWEAAKGHVSDIRLHQDANVYISESDPGLEYNISLSPQRQAYMVCIEGSMDIGGNTLTERDAIEVVAGDDEKMPLSMKAGEKGMHFLLIEMKKDSVVN
ncbi:hypothetical protein BSKO_02035 [Bryopsis sp. KO-2023]|nr:hypothetical protein BSKO_02035 [Bryopsis sp. KO-2023]